MQAMRVERAAVPGFSHGKTDVLLLAQTYLRTYGSTSSSSRSKGTLRPDRTPSALSAISRLHNASVYLRIPTLWGIQHSDGFPVQNSEEPSKLRNFAVGEMLAAKRRHRKVSRRFLISD